MTAPTPTTLTPEELAATLRHYADGMTSLYEPIHRETLTRWAQAATTAEAALSASQERERVMREALIGAKNCMELALRHTDHGGIIHAMKEGVGLINAALQPQETADVR